MAASDPIVAASIVPPRSLPLTPVGRMRWASATLDGSTVVLEGEEGEQRFTLPDQYRAARQYVVVPAHEEG